MSEQGEPCLNNMAMFSFSYTIPLMSVGTRDTMSYTNILKEYVKFVILATPIGLDKQNLVIKESFYMSLKLKKDLENFRFMFEKINPSKTTKSINKADIVFMTTSRNLGRAPHI